MFGGRCRAGIIYFIANGNPDYDISANGLAANGYGTGSPDGYSMIAGLVAEIVFTALFLLVIFGATSEQAPEGFAGIAIGLALVMIHLVTIPVTNTSVNPARSLGPALFVGGDALSQLWLFWVGPIIGGIIAAILWKSLFSK
nr:aquaporin [Persicobacter sp. CCB-QB2]